MVPELEKPRVTEINVRMDCNGCVQKIKKALYGIHGIYDMYIDFPQQKLTIIGWADPEKIIKAIQKTRKLATICTHAEPTDEANPPAEQAQADSTNPSAPEAPPTQTSEPPPQENPKPPNNPPTQEEKPPVAAIEANAGESSKPKNVEEVHVIYHHPPERRYVYSHAYGEHWNNNRHGFSVSPPQPIYHNYNTYRPSPHVTEYEYLRPSPPPQLYAPPYSRMDNYNDDYHVSSTRTNNNGNISSIFSDENPNACRIM